MFVTNHYHTGGGGGCCGCGGCLMVVGFATAMLFVGSFCLMLLR